MTTPSELFNKRVILVTGKGGVGRSSVAAAIAVAAARLGRRVLLSEVADLDLEPEEGQTYSPLARLFGRDRLPEQISSIAHGILGGQLIPRRGHELFLGSVLRAEALARAALASEGIRRLADVAPSFREMGIFYHLLTWLRMQRVNGAYEHELIVIDMPATGHSLALTGLPDSLLKLIPGGPLAAALREGQVWLNDPARTAAWAVTLPEALPVSETFELIEGLRRTHVPVGGVVLNRMPGELFSPGERDHVKRWIGTEIPGRLLGAAAFRRLEDSFVSLGRLKAGIDVPLVVVPEASGCGALVEFIADTFSIARKEVA